MIGRTEIEIDKVNKDNGKRKQEIKKRTTLKHRNKTKKN